jgi:ABC-type sugar transport system ATPase subunit
MEVADRIVIFSKGRFQQMGTPREVYEQPQNEFVAKFVGVLNVLELKVGGGVARCEELAFPAHGQTDGQTLRIGFRPYEVQVSSDPGAWPYQPVLRRTYFLGVMLKLELVFPSGLVVRSRMSKEEYSRQGLADGRKVSMQIRSYRILSAGDVQLGAEVATTHEMPPNLGEGI